MEELKVKEEITYTLDAGNLERFVKDVYDIDYDFIKTEYTGLHSILYRSFPIYIDWCPATQAKIDAIRRDKVVQSRDTRALLCLLIQDGELELGNIVVIHH